MTLLIKLTALLNALGWVGIADSEETVAFGTAVKILTDSLDKVFR